MPSFLVGADTGESRRPPFVLLFANEAYTDRRRESYGVLPYARPKHASSEDQERSLGAVILPDCAKRARSACHSPETPCANPPRLRRWFRAEPETVAQPRVRCLCAYDRSRRRPPAEGGQSGPRGPKKIHRWVFSYCERSNSR